MCDEEWGNLGDFEANDTRVNTRLTNKLRASDPEWLKKNRVGHKKRAKTVSEPSWVKKNNERMKQLAQDPSWKEAYLEGRKKLTEDPTWNKNVREGAKKRRKSIVTPFGEFDGIALFQEETGLTFHEKKNALPHLYYLKDSPPKPGTPIKTEKVFYSPRGASGMNKNAQYQWAEEENDEIYASYKDKPTWWNRMERENPDNYYTSSEPKREWLLCDNMGNPQYLYDYPKV